MFTQVISTTIILWYYSSLSYERLLFINLLWDYEQSQIDAQMEDSVAVQASTPLVMKEQLEAGISHGGSLGPRLSKSGAKTTMEVVEVLFCNHLR